MLTVEQLRAALDYNPETGVFTRKAPSHSRRSQGPWHIGYLSPDGYRYLRVNGKRYLEHRLAWFHVHGTWPSEIDHINGAKDDNRFVNLREATRSQNMANGPRQKNNTSGVRGVHFDKANRRWMAYIQVDGKFKNLGRFDSMDAATAARNEASRKAFGDFARLP